MSKTKILKRAAKKHGMKVIDIPLRKPRASDYRGLPTVNPPIERLPFTAWELEIIKTALYRFVGEAQEQKYEATAITQIRDLAGRFDSAQADQK